MGYTVHPSAIVDEGAQIGDGSRVWHWVHICSGARIGRGCSFGQNVFVGNDVVIGNNVKVQNNVSVYDAVTLEDDVFCGPSMVFTNVYNPRSAVIRKDEYRRTLIRRGATLGANSTIVCGVTVGEYAFIGAGAVVTWQLVGASIWLIIRSCAWSLTPSLTRSWLINWWATSVRMPSCTRLHRTKIRTTGTTIH